MGKEEKELEKENHKLRQSFKDLNKQLQEELEKVKIVDFPGKKKEFKNKSPEEKGRTIVRELANNEKILSINQEEHRKCLARLEMIKDPDYVPNIQKKIDEIKRQVEEMKKVNKRVDINNGAIGKNLDNIENVKGIPTNIEDAQDKERELHKFRQKLEALKAKNSALMDQKEQNLNRIRKLGEDQKKLQNNIPGYVDATNGGDQSAKTREKLQKQVKALQDGIKMTENNNKKYLATNVEKDIEELLLKNIEQVEHLEKLDDILKEQSNALKEMMEEQTAKDNQSAEVESMESLDNEHKSKMRHSADGLANLKGHDKVVVSQKVKHADGEYGAGSDMYAGLPLYSSNLQKIIPGSTRSRIAVKRDLEGQRKVSKWKETDAQGDDKLSPAFMTSLKTTKGGEDMTKMYSKPAGFSNKLKETLKNESPTLLHASKEEFSTNKFEKKLRDSVEYTSSTGKQGIEDNVKSPNKEIIKVHEQLTVDARSPNKNVIKVEEKLTLNAGDNKLIKINDGKSPERIPVDAGDRTLIKINDGKSPEKKKEEHLTMPLPPINGGQKIPDNKVSVSPTKGGLEIEQRAGLRNEAPLKLNMEENISANRPFDDIDDMFDGKVGNTEVKKPEKVFDVKPKKEEEQKNQANYSQNGNGSPTNKPKVLSNFGEEKKVEKPKVDDEFEPFEDFEDDPKPKVTKIGNNRLDLNKQVLPPKVVLLNEVVNNNYL